MKLRVKKKKNRLFFRIFLIGCLIIAMVWGKSEYVCAQNSPLNVEVIVGYHNYVKYGSYAPVKVKISENYKKLGGSVELFVGFRDEEEYYYTEEFPSGREETEVSFCVAIPQVYETEASMEVRVLDENGDELYQNVVGFQGNNQENQVYVGVLADRYEGMDYWDELQLEAPYQMGGRTISLSADAIPTESQELDMLDLIIITDFKQDQLKGNQKKAIENWVFDGGVLLFDGEDFSVEYENEEEMTVYPFETLEGNMGSISVVEKGKGRIVTTNFDTEEFSYIIKGDGEGLPESIPSMIRSNELMEMLMGKSCLQGIYRDGYRGMSQLYGLTNETLSADGIKIPSFGVYVLILTGYILILVPISYLTLRRRRHLEWLRLVIVILAVLGSGVIFLAGKNTRVSEPFIHYLEVDEYWGEKKNETVYATVQAPYNKAYEVSFDSSYQILPVAEQWGNARENEKTERITEDSGEYQVRFSDSRAFQKQNFRLKKMETSDFKMETDIQLFDGKTTGILENQMEDSLEDVLLLMPEYALSIGDMEPGVIKNLEEMPAVGYDTGNLEDMWEFQDNTKHLSKMDQKHRSLVETFLWSCYERQPCLIGFVKEPNVTIQKNSEFEQYGERMVVIYVDVNTTKDGWEYYPTLPMDSYVVTGDFYGDYQSTMGGDSGVIAYTFDGEYEIKEVKLHMEESGQGTGGRVNEVYFLNPLTGDYTLVYPGNITFSGEMLQDYINMNEIHIKFRSTAGDGETSRLPRISMIGRKRNVGN